MGIERLHEIKDQLLSCVESQMHNLKEVDAKELGEVVDMIKDMEEAMYYCTIIEAMNKTEKESADIKPVNNTYYYGGYPIRYEEPIRYNDRQNGRMYYDGNEMLPHWDRRYADESTMNSPIRDPREGKSAVYRKMYMEGQEQHKTKDEQMKELEKYMHELSDDVMGMIAKASPEEKAILRQKMTTLASKIA